MRVAIVGALAAIGMTLTSATVWSMTAPDRAADSSGDEDPVTSQSEDWTKTDEVETPEAKPAAPVDKSTFLAGKTLMVEGRLGHAKMLADARGETFLFLDVRNDPSAAGALGADGLPEFTATREPVNLAIAIDHSGSMKGQRERNATNAASGMIQRLREGDTVSVISYATRAHVVVPTTTIDAFNRERVLEQLRQGVATRPSGNTCISCGVDLAMETLEHRRPGVSRMLLLSDGEANRGVRDESGIRVLARAARNRGVTISSIGVDVDYNERLMSAIAREANGRHYFSQSGENLEAIFDQEFESVVAAVAKDGKLVVELAPGVRVAEVFDRSYQQVDNRVIVPMGTFSVGDEKTLLMRLDLPVSPAGERPVANVTLTYDDLTGAAAKADGECFGELATTMTETAAEVSPLDAIVLARLTRAETALTLQESNRLFAAGRTREAQDLVSDHMRRVDSHKKTAKKAGASLHDPFSRDLDDDFDAQKGLLDNASGGFADAAAEPAPAASHKGKSQIRINATEADALAL